MANVNLSFDASKKEITIRDHGGYQTRNISTINMLREATADIVEELKTTFSVDIYTGDALINPPSDTHLAYCASVDQHRTIMIPDHVFWAWPEAGIDDYEETRLSILEASNKPPEDPRLFWIGNPNTHPTRIKFLGLAEDDSRIHAAGLQWINDPEPGKRRLKSHGASFVSLADHCRYRYLIDLQGVGYSGRVKLLLFAGRPLFLQYRRWREYFYDGLVPFENFIPVKEDLSDLSDQIDWAESHPDHAQRIANQGREFACQNLCRHHSIERLRDTILSLVRDA